MPGRRDDPRRRDRDEGFSRRYSPLRDLGDARFDKFTERARNVMRLAQDEALRLCHPYIGTEHLLLGLIREPDSVAVLVLTQLGVSLDDIRGGVEHIIGQGDRVVSGPVGITPRAKKALELAVDEARRMNHHYLGTEHLLLGLMREGEGIAAGVLESLGLRFEVVRVAVRERLSGVGASQSFPGRQGSEAGLRLPFATGPRGPIPSSPLPSGPKNNVVTCRLDDSALAALDALVEAGIRSTRSDAAAWLIAAGIEAHRPLFDRVQTTIEEIRRLRAEAQQIAHQVTFEAATGQSVQEAPADTTPDAALEDEQPRAAAEPDASAGDGDDPDAPLA